jgi:UDP-N-acetylmuramoyl-L-alanyl-D-glutamate--2,6-diaminopimelate ligase
VVVIAGKGHERGQEIAGRITPFDDSEVASEALRAQRATA